MNIWTFFTGKSVVQTARLQDSSAVQHLKTAMQCTLHSAYFESRKTWLKFTISGESLNLFQVTNKINQFTRPDLAMIFSWLISNFPASNYCPKPTIKLYQWPEYVWNSKGHRRNIMKSLKCLLQTFNTMSLPIHILKC